MAMMFSLGVIALSLIPPLGVLLFPGLLPTLIFFPTGIHSTHAGLFIPVLMTFNFLLWSGLTFALIRLFRKFRRQW